MTYAVDEADLRARIEAETPLGEAWRCLRCGAYVLGPPAGHGAAADAPVLLRGAALRAAFILRLLAIERWVRGVIIILLGIAVLRLKSAEVSLRQLVNDDLKSLQPFFNQIHFNVTDSGLIKSIQDTLDTKQSTLTLVGIALLFYGALQLAEGVGLWSLKRWGEYIAVVGTTLFIPLEVYELTEKVTWLRLVVLLVNIAAVVYLVWSKRLFGVRGGTAAHEAQLHAASLLEVEETATTQ